MTSLQARFGSTVVSLLLLSVTMFAMCGIRQQRLALDDMQGEESFEEQLTGFSEVELLEEASEEEPMLEGDSPELIKEEDSIAMRRLRNIVLGEFPEQAGTTKVATSPAQARSPKVAEQPAVRKSTPKDTAAPRTLAVKARKKPDPRKRIRKKSNRQHAQANRKALSSEPVRRPFAKQRSKRLRQPQPRLRFPYETAYRRALDNYYKQRYDLAIAGFRELLERNTNHHLAANCQYWLGEARYATGAYYEAAMEFEKVSMYAEARKGDHAQLMVAIALLKAGEVIQAKIEFSSLMAHASRYSVSRTAARYLSSLDRA